MRFLSHASLPDRRATRSRATDSRAFTLIELILAIAIAAVVLTAITGIFFGALRLRENSATSAERARELERCLTILRRDMAGIVPPGTPLSAAFDSATQTLPLQGRVGPEFVTASGTIDPLLPWSTRQRVAYVLREAPEARGRMNLYRAVERNLLAPAVRNPDLEWLLGGVDDLTFEYHDGEYWRSHWNSETEDPPLPRAIKVRLQLAPEERQTEMPLPIELVVPLVVLEPPATNNAAATGADASGSEGDAP